MVDKITGVISPLEEVEKINEIIDNLGGKEIGEIFYSLTPQQAAGYHLADGTLISGSGTYAAFVNHMADLYEAEANCFCTEAEWQTSITTYGACGKFVYDSENNTVRLPKVTGFIEGTIDSNTLGDLVEAGLPDHTHTYTDVYAAFGQGRGGEYPLVSSSNTSDTKTTSGASNSIYGNSNTVQPQSIKGYVYIVISNVTKTAVQSDIDEIATDLNGKADTDLSNISPSTSAKSTITSWGVPDYANQVRGDGISAFTYIACTKDSYVCVWGTDPYAVGAYGFVSPDNGVTTYVTGFLSTDTYAGNTWGNAAYFVCPKGWSFTATYEYGFSYAIYPMKGAN